MDSTFRKNIPVLVEKFTTVRPVTVPMNEYLADFALYCVERYEEHGMGTEKPAKDSCDHDLCPWRNK